MKAMQISIGDAIIAVAILSLNDALDFTKTISMVSVQDSEVSAAGKFINFRPLPNLPSNGTKRHVLSAIEIIDDIKSDEVFGATIFFEGGLPAMQEYFTFDTPLPEYARAGTSDAVLKRYRLGSIVISGREACENAVKTLLLSADPAAVSLRTQLTNAIR